MLEAEQLLRQDRCCECTVNRIRPSRAQNAQGRRGHVWCDGKQHTEPARAPQLNRATREKLEYDGSGCGDSPGGRFGETRRVEERREV
jgi:hypothetical protein